MQFLNKEGRGARILRLPLAAICPNPGQPRRFFQPDALAELAESIRRYGILQPLTVRRTAEGSYQLVAGERRLRAAKLAGLREVPCLLTETTEEGSSLLALVENLQRRDLHYLEEAAAMARLITEFGLSQEELAQKLGKSQSAVANKLRLLRLSPACVRQLQEGELTERHARALLRLEGEEERLSALGHILAKNLNVAQSEEYIEDCLHTIERTPPARRPTYVIKDVRLFLNSIDRSLALMRRSGVDADWGREDTEDEILLTIRIPRKANAPAQKE